MNSEQQLLEVSVLPPSKLLIYIQQGCLGILRVLVCAVWSFVSCTIPILICAILASIPRLSSFKYVLFCCFFFTTNLNFLTFLHSNGLKGVYFTALHSFENKTTKIPIKFKIIRQRGRVKDDGTRTKYCQSAIVSNTLRSSNVPLLYLSGPLFCLLAFGSLWSVVKGVFEADGLLVRSHCVCGRRCLQTCTNACVWNSTM